MNDKLAATYRDSQRELYAENEQLRAELELKDRHIVELEDQVLTLTKALEDIANYDRLLRTSVEPQP